MRLGVYRLIPRALCSRLFYFISRIELTWIKNCIIWIYCKITGAKTDFAAEKNPYSYRSLNDFFTRALADGARSIDEEEKVLVSPVDGRCAVYGNIENGRLFQAKTRDYSLAALLNSQRFADCFQNGKTLTLYLAPDDYHRIHMPCDGRLVMMSFCPGDRHSVALDLLEKIPNIFAANERLVLHFETDFGAMALVMVGALNVSSIETPWSGALYDQGDNFYSYDPPLFFKKGQEIGRFNLGSTVILCFPENALDFLNDKLATGDKIKMGEKIAELNL